MAGLHHLNYIYPSQGLTSDLQAAWQSISNMDLREWAMLAQVAASILGTMRLLASLKPRNDSVLFQGMDDEAFQPSQVMMRHMQRELQPMIKRQPYSPAPVLYAAEAVADLQAPSSPRIELLNTRPRRKATVEVRSAWPPRWSRFRRLRYPKQYYLRLRIARVVNDYRNMLRQRRKKNQQERKREQKRQARRDKEEMKERNKEKCEAYILQREKFKLFKKMLTAETPEEMGDLLRQFDLLGKPNPWKEYKFDPPKHWLHPSDEELLEDYELNKHRYLHLTQLQVEMRYGVDLNTLLANFDPVQHRRDVDAISCSPDFLKPVSAMSREERAMIAASSLIDIYAGGPERLQGVYLNALDPNDVPTLIDTGASFSLSPFLEDFVEEPQPCDVKSLSGLAATAKVFGKGKVEWKIVDRRGTIATIKTEAYYVPTAQIRILSPQSMFKATESGYCSLDHSEIRLVLPSGTTLFFPFQNNNLPFMLPASVMLKERVQVVTDEEQTRFPQEMSVFLNCAAESNRNLTASQKKLLLWHAKCGHVNMDWLLTLSRWTKKDGPPKPGPLPVRQDAFKKCNKPRCAVCQMAKQHRRTPRGEEVARDQQAGIRRTNDRPQREKALAEGRLHPGDKVSVDHYMSASPGRLEHTKGREPSKNQYVGGTIFVDHATGFVFIKHQTSLSAAHTVHSKNQFEQEMEAHGYKVKAYHADNHPFEAREFTDDIELKRQDIDYSGVGAKHQNGIAERAIQTITTLARAMMLHQMMHWPDEADQSLWPFAMAHAVYLWNHLPREDTMQAPVELLSHSKLDHHEWFRRLHVWGAPVYVLDPKLQDGKKLPKWQPRARRGMYLGHSPSHSSLVSLVMHLTSKHVSPQYHVVIDDLFTTVPNADAGGVFDEEHPFDAVVWNKLVETGYERNLSEADDVDDGDSATNDRQTGPTLANEWLTEAERTTRQTRRAARATRLRLRTTEERRHRSAQRRVAFRVPEEVQAPTNQTPTPRQATNADHDSDSESEHDFPPPSDDEPSVAEGVEDDFATLGDSTVDVPHEAELPPAPNPVRPPRKPKPNKWFVGEDWTTIAATRTKKIRYAALDRQFLAGLDWSRTFDDMQSSAFARLWSLYCAQHYDDENGLLEYLSPMILGAKANSEDNPSWNEAMNGLLRKGYWRAAEVEIEALQKKDSWDVVDRKPGMNVLPSTWAFKCKRYPDGSVRKLKARFCVRGDRQIQGIDFNETWAPVVNWNTVRLMLILSQVLGLATKQVDYTTAFLHAPIDEEVFVQMPRGFSEDGKVLRLKRCLYGLRQSPANFFNFLKDNLHAIGFTNEPEVDPCLFISDDCICLVYVDDTLFFAPDQKNIQEAVRKLRGRNMELEEEDSVAGFLGVHIERDAETGTITLTQTGLTKRIIEALGVQKTAQTPTGSEPLAIDADGDPPDGLYNYASVVGMLLYLTGHSRPDLCFAVSQVARFIHGHKRSHEVALERIGQYLLATQDKGLILHPTNDFNMECYVDSDFAGLWNVEPHTSPMAVRSRAGFTICICGCPIIWKSQLMKPIAASTMEAEYNALALAMKEVLPLQELFKTVGAAVGVGTEHTTTFKTTVYEDNKGAVKLANKAPGHHTPRSKSFWTRSHWFRQYLEPNRTTVVYIETTLQKADILTKPLAKNKFAACRLLLCGW